MLEAAVVAEWSFVGAAGGAHPLSTAKAAAAAVLLRTVMHSTVVRQPFPRCLTTVDPNC